MNQDSAQEQWLRADLAASATQCTLAYWHHPLFSSKVGFGSPASQPLWDALMEAGADVVISGHAHVYERFAPQTPDGQADPVRGIRQFVVGTGGRSLHQFDAPVANSEVRYNARLGVLKLTLRPSDYDWEFVPVADESPDRGSGPCH